MGAVASLPRKDSCSQESGQGAQGSARCLGPSCHPSRQESVRMLEGVRWPYLDFRQGILCDRKQDLGGCRKSLGSHGASGRGLEVKSGFVATVGSGTSPLTMTGTWNWCTLAARVGAVGRRVCAGHCKHLCGQDTSLVPAPAQDPVILSSESHKAT